MNSSESEVSSESVMDFACFIPKRIRWSKVFHFAKIKGNDKKPEQNGSIYSSEEKYSISSCRVTPTTYYTTKSRHKMFSVLTNVVKDNCQILPWIESFLNFLFHCKLWL